MHTARISAIALCLLVGAASATGCASAPVDEPLEEPEVAETTEQPLTTCAVASTVAGAATGFAVAAWYTTGACAGGTLVTTAGVATPVCVIPAAAGAAGVLAGVAAGGIAYLACTETGTRTITKAKTDTCPPNKVFTPERFDSVAFCQTSAGDQRCTSSMHFPCQGSHYHGSVSYNTIRSGNCVRVTKRAVQCAGAAPFSGPCGTGAVFCGNQGWDLWGTHEY